MPGVLHKGKIKIITLTPGIIIIDQCRVLLGHGGWAEAESRPLPKVVALAFHPPRFADRLKMLTSLLSTQA